MEEKNEIARILVACILFAGLMLAAYETGINQRPTLPCDEERRIAWNDGLTLGYEEGLEGHKRPPLELR